MPERKSCSVNSPITLNIGKITQKATTDGQVHKHSCLSVCVCLSLCVRLFRLFLIPWCKHKVSLFSQNLGSDLVV